MRDRILILSNESISKKNGNYYCDNLDIKSIPEDSTKRSDVTLIGRLSKVERYHKIEKSNVLEQSRGLISKGKFWSISCCRSH